ncbi:glycosyl transferase [Microbacterium trichothecenolyticum]|uniref:Uncharacterized protein n=1 Tax=Microbacterium trichothecenolyticum TaxID=69370 RepID=A0ABU0TXE3_MICTR|nr:glycosyl transferase [Microbacterium trichothecenolyticum]MDQ1124328.1 hypothetical protein [Microbacterium trichothecenolyticum]
MTDGDHPPFPLLLPPDTTGLDDVRAALERADAVGDLGTDIAATLAWATSVTRPRSLAATWEVLAAVAARNVAAADSAVPLDWITHQLDLMDAGIDLVLGTVRPDFADLSVRHVAYWRATHHRGRPAGNVHGANLGVRASTYAAAGGIPDLAEHEDVALVRAVRALGARERVSDAHEVETSGRLAGRTPAGYAAFLARVHAWIDAPSIAAPGT